MQRPALALLLLIVTVACGQPPERANDTDVAALERTVHQLRGELRQERAATGQSHAERDRWLRRYEPLQRLTAQKPVGRISFIPVTERLTGPVVRHVLLELEIACIDSRLPHVEPCLLDIVLDVPVREQAVERLGSLEAARTHAVLAATLEALLGANSGFGCDEAVLRDSPIAGAAAGDSEVAR